MNNSYKIYASKPKSTTVFLPAANWIGDTNPWSQVVEVNGAEEYTKIDLLPNATQIVELQDAEISLMLQNDSGVVTAWAIGNKPTTDYTMQALLTEVLLDEGAAYMSVMGDVVGGVAPLKTLIIEDENGTEMVFTAVENG